ncbi:xanthine dehydrogenase family protein subunit M [Rhodopseudomonas boonkerdii]|uniref:FAD binding domain-containing protein n=1 Tax=Rhodopseudomonas boonkerdii TaxID=475937 RepID=UPI001E648F6F|nr:xanthine dehydrogenase family protein subunit M [Rhodopseudomonas boonkerdii]UGV26145.1 xanthine dehydrogenase family protein subunit M [Rhodopseudomonas boonkerdii]
MTPFHYQRATDAAEALTLADASRCRFLGGGTNLVDLMRQNIEAPAALVDVSRMPASIEEEGNGGLVIGAAVRNSTLAAHPVVRARYPMLSRALLAGASAQIRNMATVGGNLLQRTRCAYFYDAAGSRCNKRQPGAGCDAIDGLSRNHAILGVSDHCIATHPSDMCVALAALDATVHVSGADGTRHVPLVDFHQLPGTRPDIETVLRPGELITAVSIAPSAAAAHSRYRKVRDRSSYAFALVSVAAGLDVADGRIRDVRIALGGVAAKPWRAMRAEDALRGEAPTQDNFLRAAEAELAAAKPTDANAFKVELAKRTMAAVLGELAGGRA